MNEIVLQGFDSPLIAQDFLHARDRAIMKALKVKSVSSLPGEEIALEALTELQRLERGIERTRKEVKSKPFELCKQIDSLAAQAVAPLEEETRRVKLLLGEYAETKRKEALEEERIRQEEIRKIEEAKRLEEEKIAKAALDQAEAEESARIALEKANSAKSEKERQIAEKMALDARLSAEAHARILAAASDRAQSQEDAIRESLPVVAPKAAGAATKFTLKYQVTDINELFANYPHVCEISEKKSAVNILINGLSMANNGEIPRIKGLKVWREADVNTRSR